MIGSSLPLLTLLLWTPAMGAALTAVLPNEKPVLRRTLTLAFALVPELSLSLEPAVSPFTEVLMAWIPLLAAMALLSADLAELGKRTQALVLLAETSLLGLLTTNDGALWLAFYGMGLLVGTLLMDGAAAKKKFFFFQSAALALASALILVSYHAVWVETGFPSADMTRWASLVGYPDGEGRMLLLGAFALALACPLFPFTAWIAESVEALAPPGRILWLGGFSLVGTDFFDRAVLQSYSLGSMGSLGPLGTGDVARPLSVLAALGILYSGLVPYRGAPERRWIPLLVGFQGLSVLGLLSSSPQGVAAGRSGMLHLALALPALATWTSAARAASDASPPPSRIARLVLPSMVFLPTAWIVLKEQWGISPSLTVAAGIGVTLMGIRFVRTVPPLRVSFRILSFAPILGFWLLLALSPDRFERDPDDAVAAPVEE